MNSDIIKLLPDSVANQIAAGEVIQRPASVIKELVENSVDAGATQISIIVKDAGRTLIQVVDNGCGMTPTDARMAFERHATSKIAEAADIYNLHTMGFRGEALASIAAVAHIDLRTMRRGDTIGTRLVIAGSKIESQEPEATIAGSNMMVKNLFAFIPARRKFLKKESVELSHIVHEFERLALVNCDIDFTLIHNDVTMHQMLKSSFKQRIGALFGKAIESQIIPISTETTLVKISGYVGLPQYARRRGAHQFFFVNGRNMRHPYFHKAVMSCYEQLISSDSQPCYFINLEVNPDRIDVNIHPQKHEIKFEDEQAIWQILTAAIKESLGKCNAAGAIDFDVNDAPDIPAFDPTKATGVPDIAVDDNYNPFTDNVFTGTSVSSDFGHTTSASNFARRNPSASETRAALGMLAVTAPTRRDNDNVAGIVPDDTLIPDSFATSASPAYILVGDKYIARRSRTGLMLIDRRRAHIRILYDRFTSMLGERRMSSQHLMFPETLTLSLSEDIIMASIVDTLADAGFDIAPLGDSVWSINAVPSALDKANPADTLGEIVRRIAETGCTAQSGLIETVSLSMAESAAISYGTNLTTEEIDVIVADLFASSSPDFTPDGLKTMAIVSFDEIGKLFQ